MDEGWRLGYSGGTGRETHTAASMVTMNHRGETETEDGLYLGPKTTVAGAGAER